MSTPLDIAGILLSIDEDLQQDYISLNICGGGGAAEEKLLTPSSRTAQHAHIARADVARTSDAAHRAWRTSAFGRDFDQCAATCPSLPLAWAAAASDADSHD